MEQEPILNILSFGIVLKLPKIEICIKIKNGETGPSLV